MSREELISNYLKLVKEIKELEKKMNVSSDQNGAYFKEEAVKIRKEIYKKLLERTYIETKMEALGISIDDLDNESKTKKL